MSNSKNTVRAAHWLLKTKNKSAGRSLEICNTFCININKTIPILPYFNCFYARNHSKFIEFTVVFSLKGIKKGITVRIEQPMGPHAARRPPVWHAWFTCTVQWAIKVVLYQVSVKWFKQVFKFTFNRTSLYSVALILLHRSTVAK